MTLSQSVCLSSSDRYRPSYRAIRFISGYALTLLLLVSHLSALVLVSSESLHAMTHEAHDDHSNTHQCLVTLLETGQLEPGGVPEPAVSVPEHLVDGVLMEERLDVASPSLLPHGRAPPL